jgi:Protein of unknown function (DUF3592)
MKSLAELLTDRNRLSCVIANNLATKMRKPRKIVDWWTDPRKPLWPHLAGMLLPFAICAFGLYSGFSSYFAFSDAETAEGVVVSFKHREDHDGNYRMAIAEYTVGEIKYKCDDGVWWSGPGGHAVGDHVKIRFSAQNPQNAVIDSFGEQLFFPVFVITVGLIIEGYLIWVLAQHVRIKRAAAAKRMANGTSGGS